jgi:outer membrane lipoprotein-sorting protein
MEMEIWTRGKEESLVRVLSPAKDRGTSTLQMGREVWVHSPKVNKSVKISPAMMSQSWMGSDFSNNDLANMDNIVTDYTHAISGTETRDGVEVYSIESRPKPEAPVVWGKMTLKIRGDRIILQQSFYDEDGTLVKEMTASDIKPMGGRMFPGQLIMKKGGTIEEYTRLSYKNLNFDVKIPEGFFTVTTLKKY